MVCFFFFKQKTAYEISACLVGSEMCIRDRLSKASQSFAEKLYADAQNDSNSEPSNETDDVVEGEVIEDE